MQKQSVQPKKDTKYPKNILSTNEKIQIILHEYDSLWQEKLHYDAQNFQLLCLVGLGSVGASLIYQHQLDESPLWGIVPAITPMFLAIFLFHKNSKITKRVKEIERQVNELAGGEKLLIWENTR
jgi:hypothetical protein